MKLVDLKVGSTFEGPALIKSVDKRETKTNPPKPWLNLTLADKTSSVSGRRFGIDPADVDSFKAGQKVWVSGTYETYGDKDYLNVKSMYNDHPNLDSVRIMDLMVTAPKTPEELNQAMISHIKEIEEDAMLFNIVTYCYRKFVSKFITAPAAKSMHHAYYGGLAYHTSRMLELVDFICKQRPFLDKFMLKAATILHDIEKCGEMISDELGVVSDYSLKGKLMGHIVMSVELVNEACKERGIDQESERVLLLKHALLAHHNLGEWGSPVQPQTAEAVALHYIDQLDAKLQMAEDALSSTSGEWSSNVYALENKAMYKGNKTGSSQQSSGLLSSNSFTQS